MASSHHSGSSHSEAPHADRRQYAWIAFWLAVLTILEVYFVELPVGRTSIIVGLIGMAITKALLVAYYYMHLNHETSYMRWIVLLLMSIPVVYAIALCAEGTWRMWSGLGV